ncbi:MAG: hypothetical protein LBS90_06145 [Oscillospiraceae bacterium]|jgi:hypothetical protein|nr:hypothetical protein [Oscillospiraceae bacterium]
MQKLSAYLMLRGRAFDADAPKCAGHPTLTADLELTHIIKAMARGDGVIRDACAAALLTPLQTREEIEFRHTVLRDAQANSDAVRRLYEIIADADKIRDDGWRAFSGTSDAKIYLHALDVLVAYLDSLAKLRIAANGDAARFKSDGMKNLYAMLLTELDDELFTEARRRINEMSAINTVLVSAELDDNLFGVNYTLRKKKSGTAWLQWRLAPIYSFDEDTSGMTFGKDDWESRRDRAFNDLAYVLAQAARYLDTFFAMLRRELAFYIGCLNLEDTLRAIGAPYCLPELRDAGRFDRSYRNLYDLSLTLVTGKPAVGNELDSADTKLYVVTGANQGGKSTFLRSVGQAQLMAQCGMPAAADGASFPLRGNVFTHFKREEDAGMRSGKLDEEMRRMDAIVENTAPHSMVLLNESFASTNEREGSEICRRITRGFTRNGVEVFSVSHLYAYASSFAGEDNTLFLRAQRLSDGTRTFRLERAEPLATAFGEELYHRIFGE